MSKSNYPIVDSVATLEQAIARVREAQKLFARYTQEQVDKIFFAAAVAADKAKDAAEITKLTVAISGEQREIDKNYRAIGEWYVNEYEGEISDGVRDLVEAVVASKARIAELEAAKVAAKEGGPVVEVDDAKICPICGAEADSKFCPQCGAPMCE